MHSSSQVTLTRVFEIIKSLRDTLNAPWQIEETYVIEFHTALKMLESLGLNVDEFYIPDDEIKPRITSIKYDGLKSYSHEKFVPGELLLGKLDALLCSFKITCSEEKVTIIFHKPSSQDKK